MPEIQFSSDVKAALVDKLKRYFDEELDQDIGQFEGEFLLDFISAEIGAYYYNQGVQDAQTVVAQKVDEINDALFDIEKPAP